MSRRGLVARCAVVAAAGLVSSVFAAVPGTAGATSPGFGPQKTVVAAALTDPYGVAVDAAGSPSVP